MGNQKQLINRIVEKILFVESGNDLFGQVDVVDEEGDVFAVVVVRDYFLEETGPLVGDLLPVLDDFGEVIETELVFPGALLVALVEHLEFPLRALHVEDVGFRNFETQSLLVELFPAPRTGGVSLLDLLRNHYFETLVGTRFFQFKFLSNWLRLLISLIRYLLYLPFSGRLRRHH